ncbi:MAG TPA: cytochrome c family protein [Rhizomicrobium sp.]|jgi:cytochrome c|nr:cytochrome c family protein [Rhizomicrobium sp.]
MDSHEWNKIAGGVLGTILFVLVVRIAAGAIFEQEAPAKPGYIVPGVVEETASTSAAPVEEAMPDWGTVLPTADTAKGQDISHKCEQCHNLNKGGGIKIGPPLYGVVGRARATIAGFDYSSAMKAKGGSWTFDELFKFLKSPQAYIEGTKMTFAGLPNPKDRIDLIAYLRTNSDSPVPIPAPNPKAAAPAAAPAGAAGAKTAPAGSSTTPATTAAPAANPKGGPATTTPPSATPPKKS